MVKRGLVIAMVFACGLAAGVIAAMASRSSSHLASSAPLADSSEGKQLYTCGMHPQVIQDHPGNCPICHMKLTPLKSDSDDSATSQPSGAKPRKILYWWDPMLGPSSISDKPGKSAMGMEMVPVYEDQASAGPAVKIDPTIVQNMGVRTAQVIRGSLEKTVRTVGVLRAPEPAQHDVSLKINGWIQKLYANEEGMMVYRGQALFDLYSPDLQVAEEELISAVKGQRQLQPNASDALRKESDNLVSSAKRKLRLWDVSDDDIDAIANADKAPQTAPFRSPADGHMIEKMVVQGSAIQAGMKIMRIEDHSRLWLDVQIYEEQVPQVGIGETVEATFEAVPGKTFSGPITFVYPHMDHMSRTETLRISLDNLNQELRPGMYATARIITKPLADAVLVPREAVIDTGTRQITFVAKSEGYFDPRIVRMGMSGDGDVVQILEGLIPGEMVVTSGQFLMDVESRTTEAINKLRRAQGQSMDAKTEELSMQMPTRNAGKATTVASDTGTYSPPATQPAAGRSLFVIHCPMKNIDWVQASDTIANPYYGSAMLGCGEVMKKVPAPAPGSNLDKLLQAYIDVAKSLAADQFKAQSGDAVKTAAQGLTGNSSASLREAAARLAATRDIKDARQELAALSHELISALERQRE